MNLDHQRGGEESLYALYYLVPAAEEEDLLEESVLERAQRATPAPDPGCSSTEPVDQGPALTFMQALGLLRHLLGAEVLEQPDDNEK